MSADADITQQRIKKLEELKGMGVNPYANDFRVSHSLKEIAQNWGEKTSEELAQVTEEFTIAGRVMAVRSFGKASFVSLQDATGKLQVFMQQAKFGAEVFGFFKKYLDIGDIIGARGRLFRTRTNELTLEAAEMKILTKSLRPLPEKYHGLTDVEIRYRQRYVDLIMNDEARAIFLTRIRIIAALRRFFSERGFMEVETPMMQAIAGGALAKPFITHHNALNIDLYLRIAPELYLKRLLVGGFNRVFELNRNFRNEGISTQHNPEFTMLEFYQAFATYTDLMDLTEELFVSLAKEVKGELKLKWGKDEIDLTPPWQRLSIVEALRTLGHVDEAVLTDVAAARDYARKLGLEPAADDPLGRVLMSIFEEKVEPGLKGPVFITQFPIEVSPLSRRNEKDPQVVDRFELYIGGREMANAFSELNDPIDQEERFRVQLKARESGDEEAHQMDEDYLRALEYGMPPAAGEGIGIDRLVMLFTDAPSIREVILFPLLKPEAK